MKKIIIYFIIATGLLGGAFTFFKYNTRTSDAEVTNLESQEDLSEKEREELIAKNVERYQPKGDKENSKGPGITAQSAIVVDEETNEVLYAKNVHKKMPPASIIKMLTFSLALEVYNVDEKIEITEHASKQISNKINMKAGEKMSLSDLLYGLMMISANDAAYAIADAYEGGFEAFIELANEKIALLGLSNTVMANPAGLDDPNQVSTVYDMATITRYALLEHPEVVKYAGKKTEHSVYATEDNEPHWWFGHLSQMLRSYKGMIAAKTGYTDEAGTTYIGIAERGGRRLVVVLMGGSGPSANNDVKALLDYGFAN
ncbi:MAG: serine hydrolase [Patescibacteria group bacterium]|nr:serine hydrolase [Patescibacteria group bacterium]